MPELPEVETIVRGIGPRVIGRTLRNTRTYKTDVLRGVSPQRLRETLNGNTIESVFRRAKHAVFELGTGERMVIQPRMTGVLTAPTKPPEDRRYIVLEAETQPDGFLVFKDVRRLGTISLLDESGWISYTERIGPEPLEDDFTSDRFIECFKGTRQAIKKAIMDQGRLAGVGNIYANEALFRARIHPARPTNTVNTEAMRRLYRTTRHVLRQAVKAGGTTIRDYRNSSGEPGTFQTTLLAYGRGGKPCRRCRTAMRSTHDIDGRATVFCPKCQRLK